MYCQSRKGDIFDLSKRRSKKKKEPAASRSILMKLRENIDALVFALFVAMFFRTFVVELYQVPTGSMTPTLMGDFAARVDLDNSGKDDIVLFDYYDGEAWPLKMTVSAPFAVLYHPSARSFSVAAQNNISLEYIENNYADLFHPVIIQKDDANWKLASPFDYLDEIRQIDTVRKEYSRIIINKFYYWFMKPQLGDVVMFITPPDIYDSSKPKYIKRIAGKGGDYMEIKDDRLYINGEIYTDHPVLKNNIYFPHHQYDTYRVGSGNFFALGDNSSSSWDSRFWGGIPKDNIGGKALFCFWPLRNIGFVR